MQQQHKMLMAGMTIQERYRIEDFLGEGGFSTVYLVRDLEQADEQEALFALKELHNQEKSEQARFVVEGELLERLTHRALPRIYGVFKDAEWQHVFMLLEYIQGPNLEILRRQQTSRRFSLSRVLKMLEPVLDAVVYLHSQQPPVLHRDIKPANIIVPETGERTVLVDFGIAKEYDVDATTTAARRCSPGYGAPEQYSGLGTDQRTDIYGLGATCYTLLTGSTPTDAFQRITSLVNKKTDPLTPVNELVPALPAAIARAIAQAMAIGQEQRFARVEDFWQALHSDTGDEEAVEKIATTASQLATQDIAVAISRARKKTMPPVRHLLLGYLALLLLVLGSAGAGFWAYTRNAHMATGPKMPIGRFASATATSSMQEHYAQMASAYNGTVYDVGTGTPTALRLTQVRQENERVRGNFFGLQRSGMFTGVLDTSQHIFLTIAGTADHPPFFFQGTVKTDGSLVGNYCNLDAGGQCMGGYGIWSLVAN